MSRPHDPSINRRQILTLTAMTLAVPTWAQTGYPSKPITMLVPFPAGGTTDILGRLVGRHLATRLGGTVVVENKPGAGGAVGSALVAKAAGDGHALLMGTIGTHAINQYLYKKLAYDPFKDFSPISLVAMVPNVLVVNASSPIKTVKDLIAAAKAEPGKLSYASAGNGTSIHLCGALFEQMAQVSMAHVPYRGSAPAITDLLGGQTTCMFDNLPSAMPHIRSGALRAVAVTTVRRSAALPDVPTIAEAGVAGYDASSWFGIWAPASTSASLVSRLNEEIRQILAQPDVRQTLKEQGAEAAPNSPSQFAAFIQAEAAKWAKVVKTANVQLD